MLRDTIRSLREENSNLTVDILDLRSDMSLRDEQIAALKLTVRELEASLNREREFNAENRRVNADYLVNILRKFLLAREASERSKLVSVLCSILHFNAEETKMINDHWAVKNTGGLVGWLMPARPSASSSAGSIGSMGDGSIGGNGTPMKKGGKAGQTAATVDVTYDPITGGGIDLNPY